MTLAAVVPIDVPRRLIDDYGRQGFRLVFYPTRQKYPQTEGWTTRVYDPEHFNPHTQNVGVLLGVEVTPGRFLLDVDLDAPEAVALAHRLPPTEFRFGRASKPVSHAFYTTSKPVVSRKFEDLDGTVLVELRGTKSDGTVGFQTMVPPSVHPSGEVLEAHATEGALLDDTAWRAACRIAMTALLVRHINRGAFKHAMRLPLAGCLLGLRLTADEAMTIGQDVAEQTGNDASDVALTVRTTADRLAAGESVAGAEALATALGTQGKAVVARMREWVGGETDAVEAAIEHLNESHAIVAVGNKVVVMQTEPDGSIRTLWPFEEFKKRYAKSFVEVNGKRRPLAPMWLTDPRGRSYDRLLYAMPGSATQCGPRDYNGWLGFTVTAAPGDWSRNRAHLTDIVCAGDTAAYAWLLNWMAALVQHPGRHAFSAVVLRGGQGIGKGHFAHLMLGALFHPQQYLHIIGAEMLTGRFNEHLSGKALIFADESTWGGDPRAADKLKGLITESNIPIERKFLPLVEEPSALHIVIASNHEWPVSIPLDDRRYFVLDVSESRRQDDSYFGPLRQELAEGGLAAMLWDLLAHPVDAHALRHPPSTKAKRDITAQSLKPIEHWWLERLRQGTLLATNDDGDDWSQGDAAVQKAALVEDLLGFLDRHHRHNRNQRATETELGMFLRKVTPRVFQQRSLVEGRRTYFWVFPSLQACRATWLVECGWPEDYEWDDGM